MNKIIANASNGYGYKYASLSDIAKQGVDIPKMKTGTEDGKEYVYCFDKELKEWIRCAEVVMPESKGMNKAQLYGSALTYARRYSVQLLYGLACDDDKIVEDLNADGTRKTNDNKQETTDFRALVYKIIEEKKLNMLDVARQYKLNSNTSQEQFRKVYEDLCRIQ